MFSLKERKEKTNVPINRAEKKKKLTEKEIPGHMLMKLLNSKDKGFFLKYPSRNIMCLANKD